MGNLDGRPRAFGSLGHARARRPLWWDGMPLLRHCKASWFVTVEGASLCPGLTLPPTTNASAGHVRLVAWGRSKLVFCICLWYNQVNSGG